MKELIIKALNETESRLDKTLPTTKLDIKNRSITDIKPSELLKFIKYNNIPEDAYFNADESATQEGQDIFICWDIVRPLTDKEKQEMRRRLFPTAAFRKIHEVLTENGYERVGFNSELLKPFEETTTYDMYVDKDFDKLVKYYSLYFNKK